MINIYRFADFILHFTDAFLVLLLIEHVVEVLGSASLVQATSVGLLLRTLHLLAIGRRLWYTRVVVLLV